MSQYTGKVIVAPMVRVSTLPFRLLSLHYGADLLYTEEVVDYKLLRSVKEENEILGTTDFIEKSDGTVVFRTCPAEKDKLIFQIGTSDPLRALKAAKMVEPYVAGVDVNMGCPKDFSLKGGMGAALLTQPEKVERILTTLVKGLSVPVTCKIRILPTEEETLALCQLIEKCGVAAIAVHGRMVHERPRHPNNNNMIKKIAKALNIPVIANGESKSFMMRSDFIKCAEEVGCASIMIARSAMWNCSILKKDTPLALDDVIREYLQYCVEYDNPFTSTKYTIQNMLRDQQCSERGKMFLEAQTLQELCNIWDMTSVFLKQKLIQESKKDRCQNSKSCTPSSIDAVKKTVTVNQWGGCLIEMPLQFIRGNYGSADLPKMLLNTHIFRTNLPPPQFSTVEVEKCFEATVVVDGVSYRSSIREKNKRYAEQGAAMVYLHCNHLVSKVYGFLPSEGSRKHSIPLESMNAEKKQNILSSDTNSCVFFNT